MKKISQFPSGRQVTGAVRLAIGVLLPGFACASYGYLTTGVTLAVGALAVAASDLSVPTPDRKLGMMVCTILTGFTGFAAGCASGQLYLEAVTILLLCFCYSLLSVFGATAASIGAQSLMIMSLVLFQKPVGSQIFKTAVLLLTGGLWQMALAWIFHILKPAMAVRQTIAECIRETERSLLLKVAVRVQAQATDKLTDRLVAQHVRVNTAQEAVSALLSAENELYIRLTEVYEEIMGLPADADERLIRRIFIKLRRLDRRSRNMMGKPIRRPMPGDLKAAIGLLQENLRWNSPSFRYAVRVSLTAFAGFMIAANIAPGIHTYWILYTIVFVLKPTYSISKRRSIQRVTGTLAGSALIYILLSLFRSHDVLFLFLMLFITAAYSVQQVDYFIFITFLTSGVLLVYILEGMGSRMLVHERVLDTLIGSAGAFIANYTILPVWEFQSLPGHLAKAIDANNTYVMQLIEHAGGRLIDPNSRRSVRREVFVSLSALKTSYDRMSGDPKRRQKHRNELRQLIAINYRISSLTAGLIRKIT